ncbi:hypothetical protein C723_3135 [Christiangramia flava JLT2011]|uniref:Uncharacterized protein n=1 Tax=Christiangramia flava JLT2011 TaxID=1229726 RepID=A0A1L7I7H9_9FLAO|nr:hypothetical protein GRFL_2816 [Christiangramia flava JLT2011]OSS37856.1 hypothetical protein C723_3135 [Christiangramia flava JLT2011]
MRGNGLGYRKLRESGRGVVGLLFSFLVSKITLFLQYPEFEMNRC